MIHWIEKAKELCFDEAAVIDPKTLVAREDVRSMCAADKCGAYNRNWTCPPACGTVDECQQRMRQYEKGILLQSIGRMTKAIDSKCYRETERRHMKSFYALAEEIRKAYPNALCLVPAAAVSASSALIRRSAVSRRKRYPAWRDTDCL